MTQDFYNTQTLVLKLNEHLLKKLDYLIANSNYITRQEFIREAIRIHLEKKYKELNL